MEPGLGSLGKDPGGSECMKYRAVGMTREGKQLQSYSAMESTVLKWARMIAEQHGCQVRIYIWEERLIQEIDPPVDEKRKYTVK